MRKSRLITLLKIGLLKELIIAWPIELLRFSILILNTYWIFKGDTLVNNQSLYSWTLLTNLIFWNYILLFCLSFKIFFLNMLKLRYRFYILSGANRNEVLFSNLLTIFFYLFLVFVNTAILSTVFSLIYDTKYFFEYIWINFNCLLDSLLWTIIFAVIFSMLLKIKNKIVLYSWLFILGYCVIILSSSLNLISITFLTNNFYSLVPLLFSKNTLIYSGIFKYINLIYFIVLMPFLLKLLIKISKKYNY